MDAAVLELLKNPDFFKTLAAADTFAKIVANIVDQPTEPRFRRIRLANAAFRDRLWSVVGGPALLHAAGFREVDGGESIELPSNADDLGALATLVQEAIEEVHRKALLQITVREFVTRGQPFTATLSIPAAVTDGLQLKELVHRQSGLDLHLMKLVHRGEVLDNHKPLSKQLHPDATGAVRILMTKWANLQDQEVALKADNTSARFDRIIKAIEEVATAETGPQFELTDQNGRMVPLPRDQHRALVTAMALHGKGTAFLKEGDPVLALKCLREAESRFSRCPKDFLKVVDNYATIHLDICWILILLGDPAAANDAAGPLKLAEEFLGSGPGPAWGTRRLPGASTRVYVDVGVQYLRLHIAQAVFAHLSGQKGIAVLKIEQATRDLEQLLPKDEDVSELMAMGYSHREAIIALRATGQSINAAVDFIFEQRAAWRRREKQAAQTRRDAREARKLGLTHSGHAVDLRVLRQLEDFGFPRLLVAEALRRSDNRADAALDLLTQRREELEVAVLAQERDPQAKRARTAPDPGAHQPPEPADGTEGSAAGATAADAEHRCSDEQEGNAELDLEALDADAEATARQAQLEADIAAELLGASWLQDDGEDIDVALSTEQEVLAQWRALLGC